MKKNSFKNYVSFLKDKETKKALVDYYSGRIKGYQLFIILEYTSMRWKIDQRNAFLEYLFENISNDVEEMVMIESSNSLLYGICDVDSFYEEYDESDADELLKDANMVSIYVIDNVSKEKV